MMEEYDYVGEIIEFEQGGMSEERIVRLFKYLESTGILWSLQGCYQSAYRTMKELGVL